VGFDGVMREGHSGQRDDQSEYAQGDDVLDHDVLLGALVNR
jgi:hypothetical protein